MKNQQHDREALPASRLIPVAAWSDHHPWPTVGGMRHIVFNARTNGFESCIRRIGRRVLIDESEFFRCVDNIGGQGAKQ